jgi:hypothetical protein
MLTGKEKKLYYVDFTLWCLTLGQHRAIPGFALHANN